MATINGTAGADILSGTESRNHGVADFMIRLDGTHTLSAGHFFL